MSVKYLTAALRAKFDDPVTKLVLICLSDHSQDDGVSRVALAELQKYCGGGYAAILRASFSLERDGYLLFDAFGADGIVKVTLLDSRRLE